MVYVISDGAGYVKIGVSSNIGKRICQMQTGNARDLSCIVAFDTDDCPYDDIALERALHAKYYEHRVSTCNTENTEWFHDCIVSDLTSLTSEQLDKIVDGKIGNEARQTMWRKKNEKSKPTIYNSGDCIDIVKKMGELLELYSKRH